MSFLYKMPPMSNQVAAMRKAWGKRGYALFHEMGTGKTYTTINLAGGYKLKEMITGVIIICPTPIKPVWDWEVEKMSPCEAECWVYKSGDKGVEKWTNPQSDKLQYLIIGVEALSQGKAFDVAMAFARAHSSTGLMVAADESSKLKNAQATRTKKAAKISALADYSLILTGTPITQGMEDLYGQFMFLDPNIIGLKSYFVFKNMYCIMGGFENRSIIGYQREQELLDKVAPYVDIVKSEDVMDLPDKIYQKLAVEPTKQQLAAMKQLKDFMEAESGGEVLMVKTVLERLTRYQQICGGNFPFNDLDTGGYDVQPIEGKNPKMEALLDSIETLPNEEKVIIWARFRPEVDLIAKTISDIYGAEAVVEFHGGIDDTGRREAIQLFQESTKVRFFVVNQQTGSMGITLTAATTAYYFSNSFSYEERVQSEKRNHRKGQTNHCRYIDIEMLVPADQMIIKAINRKGGLAQYVEEELKR